MVYYCPISLKKSAFSRVTGFFVNTIVVMDAGRIAEQGSHDELLARKGKYHDLYMTQFAGIAT